MPRPFALEKREATEKSVTLRFRPPTGNRDVFSHYQGREKGFPSNFSLRGRKFRIILAEGTFLKIIK